MENEFEVKGPEEEQVEHKVHAKDNFAARLAVMTALLATFGAIFSYNAAHTESDAMLLKNEANMVKTEAADQWGYYQAKSTKQAVMEAVAMTVTDNAQKEKFKTSIERYSKEKEVIKAGAEKLEEKSKALNEESAKEMHVHHRWATAMMALQIAISLAAITILTKKRWMFWSALGVSVVGLVLGVVSFLGI